jgi:arginine-tRNA-protein transferase
MEEPPQIDEWFHAHRVAPAAMDILWQEGWRHFGPEFFRYSTLEHNERREDVRPLRIALDQFRPSKNHRRILRRNADLTVRIQPVVLDAERVRVFNLHKQRFTENRPESLQTFLGSDPQDGPCQTLEIAAGKDGRLVGASYLDLGGSAVSTVYGMFDPSEAKRSLGIFTMLCEITHARERGCRYYYTGYAFQAPSAFDYKKQFHGVEWFDWRGNWRPLEQGGPEESHQAS